MNAGGPSALANGAGGGLWRRGHDDGAHGGTPASLHALRWLTKRCQRAREEATGCWGDGGAIAVVLEWPGASWRLNGDGGGGEELAAALAVKKEARSEMGALGGSGR